MNQTGLSAAALSLLRAVAGFLFFCHGAQKLFHWFGGHGHPAGLILLAAIIELVGGVMICLGLFTPIAAFIASGEMAFAYFTVHQPKAPLPIQNGGELAVLFCFLFLFLAASGGGPYGLVSGGKSGRR
jgi:putative oxidoreductase